MLKISIVNTRLPALMDQTRLLADLGFMRDGHIELTFIADTIGPQRLYIQKLRKAASLPDQEKIPTL